MLIFSVAFSTSLLAQTTGKVEGVVTDADTGEPLVGAQVIIEGTLLGNITNDEGYYFILNVPVGLQAVKAQIIGYQSVTVKDVRILAGQTHSVDFSLKSTVLELPGQEIYGEREPLVPRDNTVSKERFTGETQLEIPADNVTQVITLQAGVTRYGDQTYSIRGGRPSESAIYVDGVNVKSYTTDGTQGEDDLDVGENAVEEVDVITGGFASDFGDAQSGVINIVTKEGGQNYSGQLRLETDEFMPSSSNYGYNRAQVSIGGPIPALADNLTFFFSGEVTGQGDRFPRADGFKGRNEDIEFLADMYGNSDEVREFLGKDLDINEMLRIGRANNPDMPVLNIEKYRTDKGDYPGRLIGNEGDETRMQGKIAWQASKNIKLTGTLIADRDQGIVFNRNMIFWNSVGNGLFNNRNLLGIVGYNHTISQSAERSTNIQVRASFQRSTLVQGPKFNLNKDKTGGPLMSEFPMRNFGRDLGFDGLRSILNYRPGNIPIFLDDLKGGMINTYQDVFDNYQWDFQLREGRNGQNPFGIAAAGFLDDGVGYYDFLRTMEEDRANFRLDFDSQVNKIHRVRAGADVKYWQIDYFSNSLTSSTFLNFFFAKPEMQSFYVEDRMDFQDLVLDFGFRVDSFRAGVKAPRTIGLQDEVSRAGGGVEPKRLTEVSPRLGVAHPVTDKTQIRVSYGSKFQVPTFLYLYRAINTDVNIFTNMNQFFGNPYLGFRKTTSFEVGITTLLSEDWVLDLVGYNRDIDGNTALRYIQQNEDMPYMRIYTNVDNGNVKGFDLTLRRRFSKYYSMDATYTMLFARSTGTDPEDFVRNEGFFLSGDRPPLPPVETAPNDFDQTHTFNYQFNVKLPGDFREGTGLGRLLRNTGYYLTLQANSGRPFTSQDSNFLFIEKSNASRRGWQFVSNLRVIKDFNWGGLDYSVFADIRNLFNNVNLSSNSASVFSSAGITNGVYQTTGSPYTDGQTIRRAIDDLGVDDPSLYTEPRWTDIDGDEDVDQDDIDEITSRLDFNGDGTVSIEEELTMRILARGANDATPYNFERPREVRLGFEVRF
ncbi:MAG: TonB-dependent receptor domain-containing protein [Candidatus Glassbacteria bacterium]